MLAGCFADGRDPSQCHGTNVSLACWIQSDINVRKIDYAFPMQKESVYYNDNTVQLKFSNRAVTYLQKSTHILSAAFSLKATHTHVLCLGCMLAIIN